MTYKEIVDAVIANGFEDTDRASAQEWVQARHAWTWDAEEWTFRFDTATIVFTSGSQTVGSLPSDFRAAVALYDSTGGPITPIKDFRRFFDQYNTRIGNGSGNPEAYTVLDSQIFVGPNGDGTSGLLIYEKSKPMLSDDGDSTGLPDGYDLMLVHGGKAEGFKLSNVPLAQNFDDDFTAFLNAMRRNYLTGVRAAGAQQFGAYTPWR